MGDYLREYYGGVREDARSLDPKLPNPSIPDQYVDVAVQLYPTDREIPQP